MVGLTVSMLAVAESLILTVAMFLRPVRYTPKLMALS